MVSIWDFLKKEAVCDNLSNPCMLLINHFCMVSNFVSQDSQAEPQDSMQYSKE